ncbi:MAG TPA: molybdate ABC transporter substrate-binding protein [Desulfotomaculum sp.]|nr:molybdate ABC transporter substrate-binding protein [Desulfotomaculum sp.]
MRKESFKLLLGITLFLTLMITTISCQKKEPVELTVFSGAGLKDILPQITNEYSKKQPEIKININFASSGTLQKQIEQGAYADLLILPGIKQLAALEAKDLVDKSTRRDIVADEIVLVVPSDGQKIKGFTDLTAPEVTKICLGEPTTVPAGEFAKETLVNLKLWDKLQPKLILAKDARQVLTYVETGNVDAGLVYSSTAAAAPAPAKIKVVAKADPELHKPITQKAILLNGTKEKEKALDLLHFLSGPEAMEIFQKYGFKAVSL